ncbi:MAG TPA: NUDIX domain-containing protein [Anaerolineaceae bacterium]|nr:NUDIX domain-containing protein [Anaerolineaceae bacterium]
MNDTKYAKYEQPGVTIDLVIFTVDEDQLKVLLVKRAEEPFAGYWSIPGGFLQKGESLDDAALQVMEEKTGVSDVYLEQLYTFGRPDRDPRARIITVSYFALIPWKKLAQPESRKVTGLAWSPVDTAPELAFDHNEILDYAVKRLRAKASYSNIVYGLLPEAFRLSDLQKIYETIIAAKLDKRNFRKRMLATGLLEETGKKDLVGAHRPARLYRFKKREVVYLD